MYCKKIKLTNLVVMMTLIISCMSNCLVAEAAISQEANLKMTLIDVESTQATVEFTGNIDQTVIKYRTYKKGYQKTTVDEFLADKDSIQITRELADKTTGASIQVVIKDSQNEMSSKLQPNTDYVVCAVAMCKDDVTTIDRVHTLAFTTTKSAIKKKESDNDDSVNDPADEGQTYHVPVSLKRVHGGGDSMADSALDSTATVSISDGNYTYKITFDKIERNFSGNQLKGTVTNLFYYDNGDKTEATNGDNGEWSFVVDGRRNKVKIAIWVDVMDAISGGPGSGEQEAYLVFDWDDAEAIEKKDKKTSAEGTKENQKNNSGASKSEAKDKSGEKSTPNSNQAKKVDIKQPNSLDIAKFTDIASDSWAKEAIQFVLNKHYFTGTTETTFAPEKPITRAEFITVLSRVAEVDKTMYKQPIFNDVSADQWYAESVNWAQSVGITSGVSQTIFDPNRAITREEMATMMDRFIKQQQWKLNASEGQVFADDSEVSSWAKASVQLLAQYQVVQGMENNKFNPKDTFTRAQMAQVLFNLLEKNN